MCLILVLNGGGAIWFSYYLSTYLDEVDRRELYGREVGISRRFWQLFGRFADDVIFYTYLTCVWIAFLGGIACVAVGILGILLLEPVALL